MKRKLFLLLFLIGAMSVAAQTFSVTGLDLKSERIRKKNVYEWENFILVNYNFGIMQSSEQKRHSFGFTYGRVKLFGWYANFTIGTGGHYGYSYRADRDGHVNNVSKLTNVDEDTKAMYMRDVMQTILDFPD